MCCALHSVTALVVTDSDKIVLQGCCFKTSTVLCCCSQPGGSGKMCCAI